MKSIRQKRLKEICKDNDKWEAEKQILNEGLALSRAEARRIVYNLQAKPCSCIDGCEVCEKPPTSLYLNNK